MNLGAAPSAAAAAVLYVGQLATYLCDAGDFVPTYPTERPITEDLLQQFVSHHTDDNGEVVREAVPAAADAPWRELTRALHAVLADRDVVAVVPLGAPSEFQRLLVVLLFSAAVRARSLVVVSEALADVIACGCVAVSRPGAAGGGSSSGDRLSGAAAGADGHASTVVVHASPSHITLARVVDGSSVKYSVSKAGSPIALARGDAPSATGGSSSSSTNNSQIMAVDLLDDKYRAELIAAFGYLPYVRARAAFASSGPGVSATAAGTKKGNKQKASKRNCDRSAPTTTPTTATEERNDGGRGSEWKADYTAAQKRQPGALEKLLARVCTTSSSGGVPCLDADRPLPTVVCGEALTVAPFLRALLIEVVRRSGDADVTDAMKAEVRAKTQVARRQARAQRRALREQLARHKVEEERLHLATALSAAAATEDEEEGTGHAAANNKKKKPPARGPAPKPRGKGRPPSSQPANKKSRQERSPSDDDDDSSQPSDATHESAASSSSGDFSSTDDDDDEEASDVDAVEEDPTGLEEGNGLIPQQQPLPDATATLPLLGGSIVAELAAKEVAKMRITAEEAKLSKGAIVLWKAML